MNNNTNSEIDGGAQKQMKQKHKRERQLKTKNVQKFMFRSIFQ